MPEPTPIPSTHTFLFTDIEGSTRRWESAREAMSAALARHDAILREAIESAGGTVFKTVGDAFCAAFVDPVAALRAALDAQRVLGAEDWAVFGANADDYGLAGSGDPIDAGSTNTGGSPEAAFAAIRVRMALHSGLAEERDGDYFGPTLNRVARLLAAGHGGQVLVSAVTEGLLGGHLPSGVTLRDLGEHRLKDLARAERIWQLAGEGLAAEHPSIRSLERVRHNLPVQPTALVGRELELAELRVLLERHRLVTLVGPGGMGKTRLALQAAAERLEEHADGVWFVDLAPVTTAGGVTIVVAAALEIAEEAGRGLGDGVLDNLRGRKLLLLLDNCEQVIDEVARLAEAIGRTAPAVTVLATSREALRAPGEMALPLGPLAAPDDHALAAGLDPVAVLQQYDAARLFIERAAGVRPDFRVTRANAPAIAAICRQLDGMPLALELAAARMRHMSPEVILTNLRDRFRLLTTGSRTALPRQQTLLAAIDWSHDLLDDDERRVFRRLAIFRGGWTAEAAQVVCGDEAIAGWQVLDLVTHLVDKSLVVARDTADGGTRYGMLDTIQQYAAEKLAASGERDAVTMKHAEWLRALAEAAEGQRMGPESGAWLERLTAEMDNIRAALERGTEGSVLAETVFAMAANLWWPWTAQGGRRDGLERLEALLAGQTGAVSEDQRARVAYATSCVARSLGDLERAQCLLRIVLASAEAAGHLRMQAWAWNDIGLALWTGGDLESAHDACSHALDLKERVGELWDIGVSLSMLAAIETIQGRLELAELNGARSVDLLRRSGHFASLVTALANLAEAQASRGDLAGARVHVEEAIAVGEQLGDPAAVAMAQLEFVVLAILEGNLDVARSTLLVSLRWVTVIEDRIVITEVAMPLIAWMSAAGGLNWIAATAAGMHARHRLGEINLAQPLREQVYARLASARISLGKVEFDKAFAQGQAMDLEDAIAWCLAWLEGDDDQSA